MRAKVFSDDFKKLVLLEYPNIPIVERTHLERNEAAVTRYLDNQSELASLNILYGLGKDIAWEMIERSVYREEIHKVATDIMNPSEDNVLSEANFIKKYKEKLNVT